jgi:NADPH:quinone reductase-like Zn-dependent oxidoreductase
MDYAGTVVRLGNNLAQGLAIGDKVAGWVHGGLWANKGSFAQYCKQESDLLFKVPAGFDLKEGPQYGTAWTTACQVSQRTMS